MAGLHQSQSTRSQSYTFQLGKYSQAKPVVWSADRALAEKDKPEFKH